MGTREGHRPLARGTRRTRTNEMNLIQQLEAEAIEQFSEHQDHSRIPPGRHAARRRQGGRGRAHPHPEFRRRLHRPRQSRPRQLLHGPQDQLRRGRRARLPALFAERRIRSRSSAAAPSAAPSSIICAAAPASRPASPSAATPATSTRPRPKPPPPRRRPPSPRPKKPKAEGRSLRRPPLSLGSSSASCRTHRDPAFACITEQGGRGTVQPFLCA